MKIDLLHGVMKRQIKMYRDHAVAILEGIADELKEWTEYCVFESPLEAIDACRQLVLDELEEYEEQEESDG